MTHQGEPKGQDHGNAAKKKGDIIQQQRWANRIALAAVVISALSLLLAWRRGEGAEQKATRAEELVRLSRVEMGKCAVNYFDQPPETEWHRWDLRVSDLTTYVGAERRVIFAKPFSQKPSVGAAFNIIAMYGIKSMFQGPEQARFSKRTREHLADTHIVVFAADPSKEGFTLQIGVGLPSEAAIVLINKLENTVPDFSVLNLERKLLNLPELKSLTPNQQFLVNFAQLVGALDALWIAQAQETPKGVTAK